MDSNLKDTLKELVTRIKTFASDTYIPQTSHTSKFIGTTTTISSTTYPLFGAANNGNFAVGKTTSGYGYLLFNGYDTTLFSNVLYIKSSSTVSIDGGTGAKISLNNNQSYLELYGSNLRLRQNSSSSPVLDINVSGDASMNIPGNIAMLTTGSNKYIALVNNNGGPISLNSSAQAIKLQDNGKITITNNNGATEIVGSTGVSIVCSSSQISMTNNGDLSINNNRSGCAVNIVGGGGISVSGPSFKFNTKDVATINDLPTKTSDLINDGDEGGSSVDPFVKQSEIVQSDWNEEDSEELSHVLNRTHYATNTAIKYYCEQVTADGSGHVDVLSSYDKSSEYTYDYGYSDYSHIYIEFSIDGVVSTIQGTNFVNGGGQNYSYAILNFGSDVVHYKSTNTATGVVTEYFNLGSSSASKSVDYIKIYTQGKKRLDYGYLPVNAIVKDNNGYLNVSTDGTQFSSSQYTDIYSGTSIRLSAPEITFNGNLFHVTKPISTTECTPDVYFCPSSDVNDTDKFEFNDDDYYPSWDYYTFSGYFTNSSTDPMTDMPNTTTQASQHPVNITWYGDFGLEAGKHYMFCVTKVSYWFYVGVVTKLD